MNFCSGEDRMGNRTLESPLSGAEIERFERRGYVRLTGCFARDLAASWTEAACERLFCTLSDRSSWPRGRMRPPESRRVAFERIAPRAWAAACQLMGGVERARLPCSWGDSFIINFGGESEVPWSPPTPERKAGQLWHKDGDFFRHFLDSPEQGLLVIALFSDVRTRGGGTYLACDSVPAVARFLAAHPEGVLPRGFPVEDIIAGCRDFVEVTGEVGDVLLLHPFMLHTHSVNENEQARFIINPPVQLREPMRFDREPPEEHSPVERAVLRALGESRHAFRPLAPRESIVPERLRREKQQWHERARGAR